MVDYISLFQELTNELKNYPFVEIVEFAIQPPITDDDVRDVESVLGAPLAKSIRDFYTQANGLRLHWRIKPDLPVAESHALIDKSNDYYPMIAEYIEDPFAIINILPLKETITRKWPEIQVAKGRKTTVWNGKRYSLSQFIKWIKPFDLLNQEYCMAYLTLPGSGNPQVLLLTGGYSEWRDSKVTDFESYLWMLLATKGIVEARTKIFSKKNDDGRDTYLDTDLNFWKKTYSPKLFS